MSRFTTATFKQMSRFGTTTSIKYHGSKPPTSKSRVLKLQHLVYVVFQMCDKIKLCHFIKYFLNTIFPLNFYTNMTTKKKNPIL